MKSEADHGEDSPEESEGSRLPCGIDAHCHLDRLQRSLFRSYKPFRSLAEVQEASPQHADRPFLLTTVVDIHCDPETYPNLDQVTDQKVKHAIGLHPKHHRDFKHCRRQLARLLEHPKVIACGEIGLDQSIPKSQWKHQLQIFKELLHIRPIGKPLVIHCRGSADDARKNFHATANCLVIDTLLEHLRSAAAESPQELRVHVHCFCGDHNVLEAWRVKFPKAYFGFTGKVRSFSPRQRKALQAVPADRLLLETDAPYMPIRTRSCSTPNDLGEIARLVGGIRGSTWEETLQMTRANCQELSGSSDLQSTHFGSNRKSRTGCECQQSISESSSEHTYAARLSTDKSSHYFPKGKITNICASWPGSTHDSHIFRTSNLCQHLEQTHTSIGDGFLLGDSGYPCRPFLLTPFLNPQCRAQQRYNDTLCSTRVTVERTFGRLKRRFHVLHSEGHLSLQRCRQHQC